MKRKPIDSSEGILPKYKLVLIGVLGIIGTMICLFLFDMYGGNTGESAPLIAHTMVFNFIVLYEIFLIYII